jgi:hypothetical protein
MADDVGLDPGAAGAAGANAGLWQLIAARRQADLLAEAQRRYDAEQAQRQQQNAFEQRRLDQADQRQAKLDARLEESQKAADQAKLLGQVTQFPGARVTGTQLESMGVGKNSPLRGTQFKNLEEALGGTFLTGMSGTAGAPQQSQGQIAETPHAAVGPDTYEVKPTFTEEMKGQAQALNELRAQITQQLGEAKNENERSRLQNMLDIANARSAAAEARRNSLTPSQTLDEIGKLNKAYTGNTKGERQVVQNWQQIQGAVKSLDNPNVNPTAATKAVIDAFERTLNPQGVVRMTAFQQDVGHQNLLDTLWGKFQANFGAGGHGMTPQNLRAFATQIEPLARAAQQKIDREKARISNMATPYGLPTDQIFTEEDNPFAAPAATPPAAGTKPSGIKSITLVTP